MGWFSEDFLRLHVLDTGPDNGYRATAADAAREVEAQDW